MKSTMYDAQTRKTVRAEIKALVKEGMDNRQIAKTLNDKGFNRPNGQPCTYTFVANMKHGMKKLAASKRRKRKIKKTRKAKVITTEKVTPKKKELPTSLYLLLEDTDLPEHKKLAMLRAYFQKGE